MKSTWIKTPKNIKCHKCGIPFTTKRVRITFTGYCRICRLKYIPPALGKKRPDMIEVNKKVRRYFGKENYFGKVKYRGISHPRWKGSEVSYSALHQWLRREFGSPMVCEFCLERKENNYKIHWANKSGRYLRVRSDWIRLCAKCHYQYDHKT